MTHTYTRQADILAYIRDNPGVSKERIRLHFTIDPSMLIYKLRRRGLIETMIFYGAEDGIHGDRRKRRYFAIRETEK